MLSAGGPEGQGVFSVEIVREQGSSQQVRPGEGLVFGTPGGGQPSNIRITRGPEEGQAPQTTFVRPSEGQETVRHFPPQPSRP